ncbi:Hypothetical predicted protein [Drosophila guanche]|uniref:Uncharacterized protein n=1 Tax=Drosophila guanche TaxID=7266 RepID=A0A3B0K065_DROGU|nr:Hypothetical predicted protein [Drosophila guanche]
MQVKVQRRMFLPHSPSPPGDQQPHIYPSTIHDGWMLLPVFGTHLKFRARRTSALLLIRIPVLVLVVVLFRTRSSLNCRELGSPWMVLRFDIRDWGSGRVWGEPTRDGGDVGWVGIGMEAVWRAAEFS